ncbi:DUF6339 family protein [Streptomyces sp. NPDC005811]|uniref:DUF6339 family protein n=1 Tax=Streptomyces sp. NPDC005811 TaxID=3154565 RepID=UPI0033C1F27C
MSLLYPRLLPSETERRFRLLHETPPARHGTIVANNSPRAVYSATGGRRITREELDQLRDAILRAALGQGFPIPPSIAQGSNFDRETARILYRQCRMVPGEASQRQVWAFLALVLLPDVCAWRWPADSNRGYTADRFKGTDLTRHACARLWTRAQVLHDPMADDPHHLLYVLGENDIDQIMARRSALAASPALVRAIVRAHQEDQTDRSVPSQQVLRQSLMRLLRLTAFLDLDSASEADLGHLVRAVRTEARTALLRK